MATDLGEVQDKIRGWLIVIGVVLWIDVIVNPLAFVAGLFVSQSLLFTTPYEITLAGYFVDAVANIIMLVLFMKKKRSFVAWALAYQVYSALVEVVVVVIDLIQHKSFWLELVTLIIPVLLFLYFIRSQRVKMTFVK